MGLIQVAVFLIFGLSTCFATYGHGHHEEHGGGPRKVHIDSPKIHLDSPKIHLDSPKILVNRPKVIRVEDEHHSSGHEEEGHIIHEKPIIVSKDYHGVHSSGHASAPIIINAGYGGYGHGGYSHGGYTHGHGYGHGGKILNVAGPVVVAPAPIVHDGPILVRRPVVVAKELSPTQDHLEKAHYERIALTSGLLGGHGHGHGGLYLSKGGLAERAVILEQAPLHGHGLISFSAYRQPLIITQPRAIYGSHYNGALVSGKGIHGGYGRDIHSGLAYGKDIIHGGSGYGKDIHGGLGYGKDIHGGYGYKKY